MDSEIVKGRALTKEETKFLLELIENSKIITKKKTNATNNKLKNDEWIRLTERFNAVGTDIPRTPHQLRLKWENLKKNSRKRISKIRMTQNMSGPPAYIPPDDILDKVTGLLDSTGGLKALYGGDSEPAGFDDGGDDGGDGGTDGDGDGGTDGVGDIRIEDLCNISIPTDNGSETMVTDGQGANQNIPTPRKPKRFTFSTLMAARKKMKSDENRAARNAAIAEYYTAKKQCLDAKLINIQLENENLKLRNTELSLKNKQIFLETNKLKLELKKFREQ